VNDEIDSKAGKLLLGRGAGVSFVAVQGGENVSKDPLDATNGVAKHLRRVLIIGIALRVDQHLESIADVMVGLSNHMEASQVVDSALFGVVLCFQDRETGGKGRNGGTDQPDSVPAQDKQVNEPLGAYREHEYARGCSERNKPPA
jgi:hypothetical protein